MKVYLGNYGWGWNLYGIGYKDQWFIGFSRRAKTFSDQMR